MAKTIKKAVKRNTKTIKTPIRKTRESNSNMSYRGYNGIQAGRLSPYQSEYRTTDQIINSELTELVARARELKQNDGSVVKYSRLLSANVVGANGIIIKPKSTDPSGNLDSKANDIITTHFNKWSKSPTVDNLFSWLDMQRLAIESLVTDGEVFIRIFRGKGFGEYNYQLQMLPPEYVDVKYNLVNEGIRASIEYDQYMKPIAYWVYNRNPNDGLTNTALTRTRIPASDIIHFYLIDRPDQKRGIPLISPVMAQMLDLKHYKYLSLVAARVGAGTQGFITQKDAGKSKWRGDDDKETFKNITVEPGSIQELPAGMELQTYNPSYPINGYTDFTKSLGRDIASGLGMSYGDTMNDIDGLSYSTMRWQALSDREQYKMMQRLMIDTFLEPVYENFVEMAALSGKLSDGKITLPYSKIDKYKIAQYRPRSYPQIDPLKDSNAITVSLMNQQTTLTKVIEEQGLDIEDIFKERARENELADKYGITVKELYSRVKTSVTGVMDNAEIAKTE